MRRALCIAPALLLAACGGSGGGSAALPQPRSSPAAKDVTVTAKITIPGAGSTSNRALKKIYDSASTTQGILLTVYPVSGTPAQAVTMTGGDISGYLFELHGERQRPNVHDRLCGSSGQQQSIAGANLHADHSRERHGPGRRECARGGNDADLDLGHPGERRQ